MSVQPVQTLMLSPLLVWRAGASDKFADFLKRRYRHHVEAQHDQLGGLAATEHHTSLMQYRQPHAGKMLHASSGSRCASWVYVALDKLGTSAIMQVVIRALRMSDTTLCGQGSMRTCLSTNGRV